MFDFMSTSLPELIQEWVQEHPEESALDDQAIDRFLNEDLETLMVYTINVVSMWHDFGTPVRSTEGYMEDYCNIYAAMRAEVAHCFMAEGRRWCWDYMDSLRGSVPPVTGSAD